MEDRGLLLLTGYYYSLRCETQLNQLCLGANHSWKFITQKQKEKGREILTPTLVRTLILEVNFLEIFLGERESEPWSSDNELRRGEEREKKPLVFALASNLTFMLMTAVKCVKPLITKVTKYGNLANMWTGVDLGKLILYQQSISTRLVKSDKMSLDLVDSINRGQARNLPGNLQQCFLARVQE